MKSLFRLLIIVCLTLFSCGREGRQLNVVLIGVDTLRPDHLGCYGYERPTSPNIDRLAREGVLCENAVSQSPWTLPSFATVFTSLYPTQHGAITCQNGLRPAVPTLAELLLERGYATGAIVNTRILRPELGLNKGFEQYDAGAARVRRVADEATQDALKWIDSRRDQPLFVFVHYFDPHMSYSPPAPYDTIFDPDYEGEIGKSFDQLMYRRLHPMLLGERNERSEAEWHHIRALYDGEIAFTDKAIGDLLAGLEERGLRDNTLIVFLSDHGEEFSEHNAFGHGHTLYNEVIRVPLIFSLPGVLPRNARTSRQVRLVDVAPTILDLLGIDMHSDFEGVSLASVLTGEGGPDRVSGCLFPPEVAYSECLSRGEEKKGVTSYPWKLVHAILTEETLLFNVEQDPGEVEDVTSQNQEVQPLLEAMVLEGMLAMSDTWYVKMAGDGKPHTFDLRISLRRGPGIGKITVHKLLDSKGRAADVDHVRSPDLNGSVLEIRNIRLAGLLTLAFQTETPPEIRLTFDLRIDGRSATEETFIGESLESPGDMPFSRKPPLARAASRDGPSTRPQPPYFLVWHSETKYRGYTHAELEDETLQELRALGYIQ